MSWLVFESSSIIKRYVAEIGSQWVEQVCDPLQGHQIFICDLCITEVASALSRLQRKGQLTIEERDKIYTDFLAHCRNEYILVPITRQMLEEAWNTLLSSSSEGTGRNTLVCSLACGSDSKATWFVGDFCFG